jgi:hypothetical protein
MVGGCVIPARVPRGLGELERKPLARARRMGEGLAWTAQY